VFYPGQPGPFRAAPQCLVGLLLGLRLQGLTEQARLAHQPFPGRPIGLLVMLVPRTQLAGGERFALQGGEQELGMFGVGARQRGQNPHRGPAGELAAADGGKQRLG
jgi:hypothetical protein